MANATTTEPLTSTAPSRRPAVTSAAVSSSPPSPATPTTPAPPVTLAPDLSAAEICNCTATDPLSPSSYALVVCPSVQYLDVVLNYTVVADFGGALQEGWPFMKEICAYPLEKRTQGNFRSFDAMKKYSSYEHKSGLEGRKQRCVVASLDLYNRAKMNTWDMSEKCNVVTSLPAARVIPSKSLQQPVMQYKTDHFLVTLAVMGSSSAVMSIVSALNATSQQVSGERFVAPNWLGIVSVHSIADKSAVENLDFKSYAPNADGLSVGWIAVLVGGTVLVCVAVHAMFFRNVFSEHSNKHEESEGEEDDEDDDAGGGKEKGDDETPKAGAWEERDLEAEMSLIIEQKLAEEGQADHDGIEESGQRRRNRLTDPERHSRMFAEHLHAELTLSLPPETTEDHQSFLDKRRKLREQNLAARLKEQKDRELIDRMLSAELPPETTGASDDELNAAQKDGDGPLVSPAEGAEQPQAGPSKTLGLAARRMARMMSSMKFSVTPFAADNLFHSQGEVNRQLHGGSVGSHLAMASERGDTLDRLQRARYSKLYFAPKVLTDQMYNTDDSDEGEGANRRRRLGMMDLEDDSSSRSRSQSPPSPKVPVPAPVPAAGGALAAASKLAAAAAKARANVEQRASAGPSPSTPKPQDPKARGGSPAAVVGDRRIALAVDPADLVAAASGSTRTTATPSRAQEGLPKAPSSSSTRARVVTVDDAMAVDLDDL
jgi:hypothetical protein